MLDLSIGEDYYKPIITKGAFNNNYTQYESKGDKGKKISTVNEYLDMIRPYLVVIINDNKTQSEWKIQLTIAINFISPNLESGETRTMHAKSDNVEIMMSSEEEEIIDDLFESLLQRYQEGLQSMRGSEFTFDGVNALYYDLNKISLSRGKSYTYYPEWLKNKKVTTNPKNNDNRCFQYAINVALNYEQIKKNPQRISKIRPFIANTIGKTFSDHEKRTEKV